MRNCKNVRDVCPISKPCPPCDAFMKDYNKRHDNQDRQQQARDEVDAQNRNMNPDSSPSSSNNPSPPPTSSLPPGMNSTNFPSVAGASAANISPTINVNGLFESYNAIKDSNTPS